MLTIVGTIKLDSEERLEHALHNRRSMEPIAHLLDWRLNVVGRYAWAFWSSTTLTHDDESSAYQVMRAQLDDLPDDALCFYWLEDHWFICQNPDAFLRILDEFEQSEAEVLTVSHLSSSWQQKAWLPVIDHNELRTFYRVDSETQERVWAHEPGAYLAGIPMICKKRFAVDMLECCRRDLENSKAPAGFELPPHKARAFLEYRGFIEIVPTFHIFREVFKQTRNSRAMLWDDALRMIEERGGLKYGIHDHRTQ